MKNLRGCLGSGQRALKGPLVPYLAAFERLLCTHGYAPSTVHDKIRLVRDFSAWLCWRTIDIKDLTLEEGVRYLRYRARHRRPNRNDIAGLKQLLELLRREGIVAQQKVCKQRTPLDHLLDRYALYLREERAVAPHTVFAYSRVARRFLAQRFGEDPPSLSALRAIDVLKFVQSQVARGSRKTAAYVCTALRSFLDFARYRGAVTINLSAVVPTVANWAMPSIPRSIAPNHLRRVLASCSRRSAIGSRDYAILLLLARLGLRAGAIASLDLDDVDWQAGTLRVRGKGGHAYVLPLPVEVGEAIAAYLKIGRPISTNRRLFLRAKAPIRGFKSQMAILSVVRHALIRAGIDSPSNGAHQFRHALASEMLRRGASLPEIGQILDHRNPQTTAIYAKVDLASLHILALAWPGGAR
jgi:integrase/recombinase XerD